jgi:DNA-binding NarL/FixJ family response regulator
MDTLQVDLGGVRESSPNGPVIIYGMRPDLSLAHAALKLGARGFIHAGMHPQQILRALRVAEKGEIVAPKGLLEYILVNDKPLVDLNILSPRQREILELVCEGLTNSQIAGRLFLTESTVKQHLRSTYKVLGVRNRTEAARIMREGA